MEKRIFIDLIATLLEFLRILSIYISMYLYLPKKTHKQLRIYYILEPETPIY